jgi:hypothetical protein
MTKLKAAARGEKKPTLAERVAKHINQWLDNHDDLTTMYSALNAISDLPEIEREIARMEHEPKESNERTP